MTYEKALSMFRHAINNFPILYAYKSESGYVFVLAAHEEYKTLAIGGLTYGFVSFDGDISSGPISAAPSGDVLHALPVDISPEEVSKVIPCVGWLDEYNKTHK